MGRSVGKSVSQLCNRTAVGRSVGQSVNLTKIPDEVKGCEGIICWEQGEERKPGSLLSSFLNSGFHTVLIISLGGLLAQGSLALP